MHHSWERSEDGHPSVGGVRPKGKGPGTTREAHEPTVRNGTVATNDARAANVGIGHANREDEKINRLDGKKRRGNQQAISGETVPCRNGGGKKGGVVPHASKPSVARTSPDVVRHGALLAVATLARAIANKPSGL